MERVNQIINHTLYKKYLAEIKKLEQNRIFCRHDMSHFLDVCRIAEIEWLNYRLLNEKDVTDGCHKQYDVMRRLIYATGLLHDIGRWQEYESGISHEVASSALAGPILEECGFEEEDIEAILTAIGNHRNKAVKDENNLSGFTYRADKKSRACFACEAEAECDWSKDKKNMKVI